MTTLELKRFAEAINKTYGDDAVVSLRDDEDRDFCRSLAFYTQEVHDDKKPLIVEIGTCEMDCIDMDIAARVTNSKKSGKRWIVVE